MKHPNDSLLLAYTRHQSSSERTEEIQQHMAGCQSCRVRCAEFMQVSAILETWATSSTSFVDFSLAERVMTRINKRENSFVEHLKQQLAPTSWRFVSLPAALLLVILCTAVIIALAYGHLPGNTMGNVGASRPVQTNAVTYAGTIAAQPTPTSARGSHPLLQVCSTREDLSLSRLRLCGSNFTPNSKVVLTLKVVGKRSQILSPLIVDARGMIEEALTISNCKDVPSVIVAQNMADQAEMSQIEHIEFGECSAALGASPTPGP